MSNSDNNKVLFIDLTSGSIKEEEKDEGLWREFIGGAGVGVRILYEHMKPKIDPLSGENMLGFVAGLLTGTPVPSAPRYSLVGKSPITGGWGDSSSGGYFGHELRAAGYDAVFFRGIASRPVYLRLQDGEAELVDAGDLWGKTTYETEKSLRRELGSKNARVACIGPAGESQSFIAGVFTDGSVAARSGLGAVMGSKRLKAIAVRGRKKIHIADKARLDSLRKNFLKELSENAPPFIEALKKYGTILFNNAQFTSGAGPIKNWSLLGVESFPNYTRFNPDEVIRYEIDKHSCWGCPIGCKGYFKIEEGPYAMEGKKTEYETFFAFGPLCMNDDVQSTIKAGYICDQNGMDTISAGTAIAFAMECYERGVINEKDTDGIELTWGNAAGMLALLEKMAKREGFGAVLADGTKKASEKIGRGSEEWAIHVGGQEPGMHDPRVWPGRGLAYICDPTPGRHTAGTFSVAAERGISLGPYPGLQLQTVDVEDYKEKGPLHAIGSVYYQLINACGMCLLPYFALCSTFPIPDCISAVTGWDFTIDDALKAGKRIQTLRQVFNLREGLEPTQWRLPERISVPADSGPFAGRKVDFETMRDKFYQEMGWDIMSGWPLEETLKELRLMEFVGFDKRKGGS